MNPTIVKACVQDQHLQLVAEPFIASGGVNVVQIQFEFCGLWTGCGKTAVFYRDPAKTYLVPLEGDRATVPHEVMADEGFFYFGVMGSASNVRTTEVIKVKVARGAIVTEPAESEAPTVYQQMMARWTEAIAMRDPGGSVVIEYDDPDLFGNLQSSGAKASIYITFGGVIIEPGESFDWDLPESFAPWGDEADLTCFVGAVLGGDTSPTFYKNDDLVAGIYRSTPHPIISITNTGDLEISGETGTEYILVQGAYDLASVSIAELADVRVGADGTTYPTAGDAVRALEGKIPSSVQRDEKNGYTTITDKYIEIVAGENDDSMIELHEDGIDIHANGGVSISNVVDPTQDDDAVNKKYVDDIAKQFQPGGGGGGEGVAPFYAVYDEDSYDDIVNAHHAGRPVYAVREADGIEYVAPLQSVTGSRAIFHTSQPDGQLSCWQVWKDSGTWSAGAVPYATETYVDEKVGQLELVKIVTELPDTGEENKTYFVTKTDGDGNDIYDEYMWINGAWEYIGTKQIEIDLTDYVKNTDYASSDKAGVVKMAKYGNYGLYLAGDYALAISQATEDDVKNKSGIFKPITPARIDLAVKMGVTTNAIELTDEEKAAARAWMGAVGSEYIAQLEARIAALEG